MAVNRSTGSTERATVYAPSLRVSPPWWKRLARIARQYPVGTVGAIVIILMSLSAILADVISPYDPYQIHLADKFMGPSAKYLMGTDSLGRDVLSRLIHGGRISLFIGITAVVISRIGGVLLGMSAGYFGGKTQMIIMRLVDAKMAFPALLLALLIVAMLGNSLFNVIIALSLTALAPTARIMEGVTLSLKQNDYVLAARALGASHGRILSRHIFPNALPPLIVISTVGLATVVLAESSLSFLGLGPPEPTATWGSMLSTGGRAHFLSNPWLAVWPGIAITLTTLSWNMLGDTLRDIWDPRLRGAG